MSTRQAGDIIRQIFANMKISSRGQTVFEAWPELVGEETAEHLKIKDIKGKVLLLEADHPGWIQVAQLKKKGFLEKIKEKFPDKNITTIKISLR